MIVTISSTCFGDNKRELLSYFNYTFKTSTPKTYVNKQVKTCNKQEQAKRRAWNF